MKSKAVGVFLLISIVIGWAQDYKPAAPGYRYSFPRDYFNHEEYETEWWYYTGNLRTANGHRFGCELTFFRQGASRAAGGSPWLVRDVWMAHMALSDIDGQRFYHEERLNRAGPGIAGVNASSGLVWNGNWQADIGSEREELRAVGDGFGFQLKLAPAKPPVIHGVNGVSQKAEGDGHASHYFSLTRLITNGVIDVGGKAYQVDGTSWMDHEFFTESMASTETGWDWLSAQLQDGTELMIYRLRNKDGSISPYSSGTYVDREGRSTFLSSQDFEMIPSADGWKSLHTDAVYPLTWHLRIPRLGIDLEVTTRLRDQEMTGKVGPNYWEGAVDLAGSRSGNPIPGAGYLELTGYATEQTRAPK